MSFQAMTWATEQEVPAMQKIVLLMMANRTNHETGLCFPSHDLLAKECGMAKRSVIAQIEKLESAGLVEVIRSVNDKKMKNVNKYKLNLHKKPNEIGSAGDSLGSAGDSLGSAGDSLGSAGDSLGGSAGAAHKPVTIEPVKEPVNEPKESTAPKPASKFTLPDFINADAWDEFEQHRKDIRKPLTDLARKKAVNQLKDLTPEQQQEVIDYSITGRYPGLFPDRIKQKSPAPAANRKPGFKQPAEYPDYSSLWGGDFIDSTAKVVTDEPSGL